MKMPELNKQELEEKIINLRKQGKDVTLEDAKIKTITPDINYLLLSYSETAVKNIKEKINKINQELDKIR